MILSENSSTLGSRCCSAARSETEWQRNESWKVRRLVPKLNMRPERRPLQVGVPQGGACVNACGRVARGGRVAGGVKIADAFNSTRNHGLGHGPLFRSPIRLGERGGRGGRVGGGGL